MMNMNLNNKIIVYATSEDFLILDTSKEGFLISVNNPDKKLDKHEIFETNSKIIVFTFEDIDNALDFYNEHWEKLMLELK